MWAFQVQLNDAELCTAGIGDDGVLTVILSYVTGRGKNDLGIDVGGLLSPTQEHVRWRNLRLKVGDEVKVRVIEAAVVDKPRKRWRRDPGKELKATKSYVRRKAKELGWGITVRRSKSS